MDGLPYRYNYPQLLPRLFTISFSLQASLFVFWVYVSVFNLPLLLQKVALDKLTLEFAIQWQAWCRTTLTVHGKNAVTFLLNVENALEFWLGDRHFFGGDYYAYHRAPVVVHLASGQHTLNIRLIRDVRLFGGQIPPSLTTQVEITPVNEELLVDEVNCILPDTVEGRLASSYLSITVTNTSTDIMHVHSLKVKDCRGNLLNNVYKGKSLATVIH